MRSTNIVNPVKSTPPDELAPWPLSGSTPPLTPATMLLSPRGVVLLRTASPFRPVLNFGVAADRGRRLCEPHSHHPEPVSRKLKVAWQLKCGRVICLQAHVPRIVVLRSCRSRQLAEHCGCSSPRLCCPRHAFSLLGSATPTTATAAAATCTPPTTSSSKSCW